MTIGPLQDPQEEQYCRSFLELGDAQAAWITAYGDHKRAKQRAYELRKSRRIQIRIAELAKEVSPEFARLRDHVNTEPSKLPDSYVKAEIRRIARAQNVDEERIIRELLRNLELAQKDGDIRAANECVKLLGSEIGMFQPAPPQKAVEVDARQVHIHAQQGADWSDIKQLIFNQDVITES